MILAMTKNAAKKCLFLCCSHGTTVFSREKRCPRNLCLAYNLYPTGMYIPNSYYILDFLSKKSLKSVLIKLKGWSMYLNRLVPDEMQHTNDLA